MLSEALRNFISTDLNAMRFPGFLKKRAREIQQFVDNVAEGKGWRIMDACPLCGRRDRKILFSRCGIDIVQCSYCTAGYTGKFPLDSSDVHSHADYLPVAKSGYLDNVDYRKQRFAKERLALIAKHSNRPSNKTRILDIGCGTGWFLEAAREAGYQVSGQEVGRDLAAFTAKRLGVKVWNEPFTEIPGAEKFDVITLFDVIEHVPNPRAVIKAIEEHLHPSGVSLIFTPNLDSFAFWKLKEESSLVTPAEHLFYFTKRSLGILIADAGLEVLDFQTKGMDIPDLYSYYRDETKYSQVAEFLKENCSVLQAIIDEAKCANHMRFIVKKR